MAKTTFRYVPMMIPATSTQAASVVYRPQRSVVITSRDGRLVRLLAILDTGADTCMFPLSVAVMLGLDVLQLPRGVTAGNRNG